MKHKHISLSGTTIVLAVSAALAAYPAGVPASDDGNKPQNPAEVLELPTVEVIGTTPLPGLGTPVKDVPANVQVLTGPEISKQKHTDVSEYLDQNPTSVTVNAAQGNPFQVDINFRGFTASPLLGTPQGISVFQDGVRINEPFGDVVNWDLIPQSAISSIQIVPGSNPVFGLNTLGGALAIYTKSGFAYPGASIEASIGSFNRQSATFQLGGNNGGNIDYFLTANYFDEDGWGDHNPSTIKQFFGKVGYESEKTNLDVSLTAADNELEGMQSLPISFIRDNPRQAYTFPDINQNSLTFVNAKGNHFFTGDVLVEGNVYYRKYENTNTSSNINDELLDDPSLLGTENTGINDRSVIDQDGYGGSIQLTLSQKLLGKKNQFVVGASADLGKARFTQQAQEAEITPERSADGGGNPFELETDADTKNRYFGIYFSDTFHLTEVWSLTVAGRYNRAKIEIADRTGNATELNGNHTFSRFNPAVGVNFNPTPNLTAYAAYNEGMRAPSPIELTCADPNFACRLPNNFLADPPLEKVVSNTFEIGARGKFGEQWNWSAAAYRTDLNDDILFINSPNSVNVNAGFFDNVGDTRRQGVELALGTKFGAMSIIGRYSYIDATFETPFQFSSEFNSSAVDTDGDAEPDTVSVRAGSKIPGIPEHSFKLRAEYEFSQRLSVGANVIYASSVYARGDENNADESGKIPGYTVVNLDGRFNVTQKLQIFARVNNLFDKTYANFGVLGINAFNNPTGTFDPSGAEPEQFRSLGAPFGVWVGARYAL